MGERDREVEAGKRAVMAAYLFGRGDLDQLAKQVMDRHFTAKTDGSK